MGISAGVSRETPRGGKAGYVGETGGQVKKGEAVQSPWALSRSLSLHLPMVTWKPLEPLMFS